MQAVSGSYHMDILINVHQSEVSGIEIITCNSHLYNTTPRILDISIIRKETEGKTRDMLIICINCWANGYVLAFGWK